MTYDRYLRRHARITSSIGTMWASTTAAAPGTTLSTFAPAFVSVANTAAGMACDGGSPDAATAEGTIRNATRMPVPGLDHRLGSCIKLIGYVCARLNGPLGAVRSLCEVIVGDRGHSTAAIKQPAARRTWFSGLRRF